MKDFGIDKMRKALNVFNDCNESFNQRFCMSDLLMLYYAYAACGWDITPDQWEEWQVEEALQGIIPKWDDNENPIRGESFVYAVDTKTGRSGGGISNNLVAAAQDLLEASITARRFLDSLNGRVSEEVWRDAYDSVSALTQAIAKAKGLS